jgi:signal transduction histidine kinase
MGQGLNLSARRKDGSQFPVEISLTYARGTARGDLVVATVIDITERLALEQEARRAETIISLGTLAAGIAHDLNNPLQVIRSRAELLLEPPGATDAEMKEDLTVIHRQAERASRIVEEFLELSRYREKRRIPLNINRLIEKALMLIAEDLRRSGVAIRTELDRDLPEVNADATALERVLINLLMNARDAMADGGIVMIVTETPDGSPDWTHLKVADNGPGIRPEVLGKIFDLLYTTKSEGSGLGLWLSRRIIHEHNGKIEVKSELGKGTTFVIRLPAETPDS